MTCNADVKGGGTCRLDSGHRGYHSTVVFGCDGCGKVRRGQPHASNEEVAFCFLCMRQSERENGLYR